MKLPYGINDKAKVLEMNNIVEKSIAFVCVSFGVLLLVASFRMATADERINQDIEEVKATTYLILSKLEK